MKENRNEEYEILFRGFRKLAAIKVGEVSSTLSAIDIFNILLNRCCKIDNGIKTTDFEEIIANESGFYIVSFIDAHYQKFVKNNQNKKNYNVSNLYLSDYDEIFDKKENISENFTRKYVSE